jgi:hypothetical protein
MNDYMKKLEANIQHSEWVNTISRTLVEALPTDLDVDHLGVGFRSDRNTNIADLKVKGDPGMLLELLEPISISRYSGAYGAIYPTITREHQYDNPVKALKWIEDARLSDIGNWYLEVWWCQLNSQHSELIWYTDIAGYMVKVKHELKTPIFEWYDEPDKDRQGHILSHAIKIRCEIPEFTTWITIDEEWAGIKRPIQTAVYWLYGAERFVHKYDYKAASCVPQMQD